MLYAETNYKIYKYSLSIRNIVTKLYIWINQQVTFYNILYFKGTSETTRNNIHYPSYISIHVPSKLKPLNDNQLGYYLAGLIDGDGNFNKQKGYLTIAYDSKDKSAAYWLKSQIGYGSVLNIKNKNAIKYVVSHSNGLLRILELINNKIKTDNKYNQIINYLLVNNTLVKQKFFSKYDKFNKGNIYDFNNHWLAGFIDADGSFQIKIVNRCLRSRDISPDMPGYRLNRDKPEIRLKLQIAQKDIEILNNIKLFLCTCAEQAYNNQNINNINNLKGCYIGKREHINGSISYYLETTSFSKTKEVISYLDKYQIISYKYINYLYFRKAYLIVQNKEHLTEEGINKIKELKDKMKYKKDKDNEYKI